VHFTNTFFFADKQEDLTELQVKYEEGNTTLQEITDLQQATVVPQTALATTNNIESATRKSQRERKRKKLPGESDDEVANDPEPTTSKGKGKKMNKEEQAASYESVLEKINSAREQVFYKIFIVLFKSKKLCERMLIYSIIN